MKGRKVKLKYQIAFIYYTFVLTISVAYFCTPKIEESAQRFQDYDNATLILTSLKK